MVDALLSAGALAEAIRDQRIGCREALDTCLDRVERLNPPLNAVVALDADAARERADAADAALARGESWGPLHGVPMTVKDTYEVAGMAATSGAPELKDHRPENNAVAVQRLLDAGAVIFGKTNTSLYAGDIQTYNEVFGTTNSPWDTTRTPGGSSGGPAAALAAGMTALELGSDLGGSIRIPAHWCGVYGHKPSYHLIPLRGHIPGPPGTVSEPDLGVSGPLARDAADLEMALDVLAGPGEMEADGWRLSLPPARAESLGSFRVACWFDDTFCPVSRETGRLLADTAQALRDAGAPVDETITPPLSLEAGFTVFERLLEAILGFGMPQRDYNRMRLMAPLARLFGRDRSGRLGRFMDAGTQRFRDWVLVNEVREQHRLAWREFFDAYDVLLMPVTPTAAIPHTQKGNLFSRTIDVDGSEHGYFGQLAWIGAPSAALLPATVAPIGRDSNGLPIGIQIVGPYLGDRTTIAFARLLAEHIGGFTPPPAYKGDDS